MLLSRSVREGEVAATAAKLHLAKESSSVETLLVLNLQFKLICFYTFMRKGTKKQIPSVSM